MSAYDMAKFDLSNTYYHLLALNISRNHNSHLLVNLLTETLSETVDNWWALQEAWLAVIIHHETLVCRTSLKVPAASITAMASITLQCAAVKIYRITMESLI